MTNRGWFILFLGAALVGIGPLALNFPVFLDAYDQWGWQIKCGTGYNAEPRWRRGAPGASRSPS